MNIEDILNEPFTFTKRKQHIPCDVRPIWKMSLVLLIIGLLRKNERCTLKKVHVANWLTKNKNHLADFVHWSKKETVIKPEVRLEPSVDRAIELLLAEGLITKKSGKIEISNDGLLFYTAIEKENVFLIEKQYLNEAKRYLSEANVDRIFKVN
jgi:hypothetical protein